MTTAAFSPAPAATADYQLDDSQRAVLRLPRALSGAVLGAPGTGKTTTLVELVAARVGSGELAADEVLVLAPTRVTATALRDRLALRLDAPTNGPLARTSTSLAFQIVGARARALGTPAPRLLTGAEQDQIIAELLAGHLADGTGPAWPDPLVDDVRRMRGFRTELRELMARAAAHGVDPHRLAALGRLRDRPEWVAAAGFMAEYQQVVDSYRGNHVDSAELLAAATTAIRAGHALEGTRLVVVDDLQESTVAGLELLAAVAARGIPVVAFGDPDVATTGFRGATAEALGQFGARLGLSEHATLVLSTVYRQGAALRALTSTVTGRIGAAAAGRQRAATVAPADAPDSAPGRVPPLVRIHAPSHAAELAQVARKLREHHLFHHVPWSAMAVIVRSGAQLPAVVRAMAVAEVPARTAVGGRALRDDHAARHLLTAVAVTLGLQPLTAETAAELLLGPLGGIDSVALRRLRLALRQEELAGGGARSGDDLVADALAAPGRFATLDSAPARRAGRLAATLAAVREQAQTGGTIEELLWQLWERSGLANRWFEQSQRTGLAADEANRNLDGATALFTAAKRFVERNPGRPAADFVEELLGAEVPEDTLAPQALADSVLLCTPSGAIGMEFEVVAVSGLQENVWPNLRPRGSLLHPQLLGESAAEAPQGLDERAEVLGDELRMFALAVSRARTQVILTATENDDEQPSPFLRLLPDDPDPEDGSAHPLSLRGLVGRLRRQLTLPADSPAAHPGAHGASHGLARQAAANGLARLAAEGVAGADPEEWYGVLPPSTSEPLVDLTDPEAVVAVSPSKLETFEKSPLAWFIDTMAASPSAVAAGIGTVVHAVLEEASQDPDGDVSVARIWSGVQQRWSELQFESAWLAERERRRTDRLVHGLSQYLGDFGRSDAVLLGSEGSFELPVGRAVIRGKIDRVERTTAGTVVIVDLKTGKKVPSAAEVAGHAQLGAYQLALAAGVLENVPAGAEAGGAKLLFAGNDAAGRLYKEVVQPVFGPETLQAFAQRVEKVAEAMAQSVFDAVLEVKEHDPHSGYEYRIHVIPAVSA